MYDYAIHWFDILTCFLAEQTPRRVYASTARTSSQSVRPTLLAQAVIEYDHAQASIVMDADTRFGSQDRSYITGSLGTASSGDSGNKQQQVTLYTAAGVAQRKLTGCWFPDGFHGAMGELLSAIAEGREATNSGEQNLTGLATCFAAIHSAETGEVVVPGKIRKLADGA